ncbi:MAG: class I SAM-dependent methyltransferase [Solirubrobacteraceae bacterium]
MAALLRERVGPAASVLEIDCHDGHLLAQLAEAGLDTVGVEPSPFAEAARERGLTVRREYFDAASFTPASFDLVVLRHVLEHVEEPVMLLEEIGRVLHPDGLLFLELPNSLGSIEERYYPEFHIDHRPYFTASSLREVLRSSGFVTTSIESVDAYLRFPFLLAFAQPGSPRHERSPIPEIGPALAAFAADFERYRANLVELPQHGRLAVWGSGALGTQYAIDGGWNEGDALYVDPNPATTGPRLSVTGHVVHAPGALTADIDAILVASS